MILFWKVLSLIRQHRRILTLPFIFICILVGMWMFIFRKPQALKINSADYLLYLIRDDPGKKRQLIFYDPTKDDHTPILPDWEIYGFSFAVNNRLAFVSSREGNSKLYILDYPFWDNVPINIADDPDTGYYLFSWSPDGQFLVYESIQDDKKTLWLWDG
jgi:dipeptidyl aminopeptidase/acylaminoacyl peptidase